MQSIEEDAGAAATDPGSTVRNGCHEATAMSPVRSRLSHWRRATVESPLPGVQMLVWCAMYNRCTTYQALPGAADCRPGFQTEEDRSRLWRAAGVHRHAISCRPI